MKATLTSEASHSGFFTLAGNSDVKIKTSSDFVGATWLEFLIPDEEGTGIESDSVSDKDNAFEIVSNDASIQYRFGSRITAGSAVCYVDGTEVV